MMKAIKLVRALTISLALNLILLIVLLSITVVWRKNRGTKVAAAEQQICQPCSDLAKYSYLPEECLKMQNTYDEDSSCCCQGSSVIDILVKKFAENQFYWYTNGETAAVVETKCTQETPMGKISGLDFDSLQKETREKGLVYWNRLDQSIAKTVRYSNGRLYIRKPGIYLIFSQIKYRDDPESRQNPGAIQVHSLHRYSFKHGRSETLAENERDFSQLHVAENSGTSFIVTVIKGFNEDELMIKSSHTHMLSGDNHENFFGLYLIEE